MRTYLVIIAALICVTTKGQSTLSQINRLLQGTWVSDSTGFISKFDTIGNDTSLVRFTQNNYDDDTKIKASIKYRIVNKDLLKCKIYSKNTSYSLSEVVKSEVIKLSNDQYTDVLKSIYVIISLSDNHLVLCTTDRCRLITYTKQ